MRKILCWLMIGGLMIMFSSCGNSDNDSQAEVTSANTTSNTIDSRYSENNDIAFNYDTNASLSIEDFDNISVVSSLYNKYPYFALRNNNNQYYTIYSLSNSRLCYVIIDYLPDTGITFAVKDYIEYPFKSESDSYIYDFLLKKDYPENLLK